MDQGIAIWLTGLPASGKTTLASELAVRLRKMGQRVEILDGDELRRTLSSDLGFSPQDRLEHNRRLIFLAKLLMRNGIFVLLPLISPYRQSRQLARENLSRFIEVFVKCPIEVCIERDPKGLYARELRGEIIEFTGISAPYEEPEHPDVVVETNKLSVEEAAERIVSADITMYYLSMDYAI